MTSTRPAPSIGGRRGASLWALAFLAVAIGGAALSLRFAPNPAGMAIVSGIVMAFACLGAVAVVAFAFGALALPAGSSNAGTTQAIADSSPDALVVTDSESRIVYANGAYRALSRALGAPEVKPVERLFTGSPDVSESVYRLAQAAKSSGRASEDLRLAASPNGPAEVTWYRIRVRPLEGDPDRTTLWTVSDETREHDKHETFFQDLQHAIDYLDHAPAGFFSAEADGAIVHMNATLAGWLDYDLAQFGLGQLKIDDVIAGDGGVMLATISGQPGEVATHQFDVDLKPRHGRLIPARILHKVAFASDGSPGPSRSVVINRAPHETKGEDHLRVAEVRFARIFNSTPVAIAAVDAHGGLLRPNAAFARLASDVLKAHGSGARPSIFKVVAERDHEPLKAALGAAANGQVEIAPLDVSLEGSAAVARSARLFVSAADPAIDEGASATVFALDTTEQRTLQENLAQSQKMQAIGQLAGGVAHDFNNVLTAIIGYSDLLLANHRPTDPSFQDIMQIKQNANRAAGLVRQLLAFSRRQTLLPQTLQLNDVLSDLQMLMRRLVGEPVALDVAHGRDLWLVKADLNQFEQVIVNLIVNARDAMPDGGKIMVRTRNLPAAETVALKDDGVQPADYVQVEVEDTGHGVPEDVRAKIFEPFFTTKEVGKGTGLGLSMVYGIVKQTGGYVFCDSDPGKGATFRILLPRLIETEAEAQPEPARIEAAKPAADLTGRGAILLVEDEEAVRAFAARALASRGYTVLEAETGLEALDVAAAAEQPIDLIVSDVIMPEMDGPTMLTELRRRGLTAKVVFVSGYADDAFARNLPEKQDFTFLPKPFTLKQLIETVKATMG